MTGNLASAPDVSEVIVRIRGQAVILDSDLAKLYGVTTRQLNQQAKRNRKRFPEDFMFQLSMAEYRRLRSQNVTLKRGQHRKYAPYVFTEHGAIQAANVLRSEQAEQMGVARRAHVSGARRRRFRSNSRQSPHCRKTSVHSSPRC